MYTYIYTPSLPYITTPQNRLLHLIRYVALTDKQTNKTGRTWARFSRRRIDKLTVCGSHINGTSGPIKLHTIRQRVIDFLKSAFRQYTTRFSVIPHATNYMSPCSAQSTRILENYAQCYYGSHCRSFKAFRCSNRAINPAFPKLCKDKTYFFIVVPRILVTSRFFSPTNALFY